MIAALPPFILVSAFAPALLLLMSLVAVTRRQGDCWLLCAVWFVAGAVFTAPCAAWINQLVGSHAGEAGWARIGAAPVVEELLKALTVVASLQMVALPSGSRLRSVLVRGLCVGLGFTATENTQYLLFARLQGGSSGLWQGVFVRGVIWGSHHAIFAAAGAVAIFYLIDRPMDLRRSLLWGGFAIAQHVAWNGVGAPQLTALLCAAPAAGTACRWPPETFDLYLLTPLWSAVALFPGIGALLAAYRQPSS